MSIETEIIRIRSAKNTINKKIKDFGLTEEDLKIDDLAEIINAIAKNDAGTKKLAFGEEYTIPSGYHSGSGVVKAPESDAEINLQDKTFTPDYYGATIEPDTGYDGLSSVVVYPVPKEWVDTTDSDATQSDIRANKKAFVQGKKVTGNMSEYNNVSKTLDVNNTSYTIPIGYHTGNGNVKISLEEKGPITPTKSENVITPTDGKLLSKVTIDPIPEQYINTESTTPASSSDIIEGKTAFVNGQKVNGNIKNIGDVSDSINGMTDTTSVTIEAGYTTGGTISLTDDILNALKAI